MRRSCAGEMDFAWRKIRPLGMTPGLLRPLLTTRARTPSGVASEVKVVSLPGVPATRPFTGTRHSGGASANVVATSRASPAGVKAIPLLEGSPSLHTEDSPLSSSSRTRALAVQSAVCSVGAWLPELLSGREL